MKLKQVLESNNITKELLDQVQVNDRVCCNDWKQLYRVIGVGENYFVMVRGRYYSICEKIPATHSRNNYTEGCYRIGTDSWLFFDGPEDINDKSMIQEYLETLETGETELSVRTAVDLRYIKVMRY